MMNAQKTILIADDDALIRQFFMRALRSVGFRLAGAEDGVEALASLRADPADLVLLDGQMPNLDGFAALAAMQADQALRHIPVIMLTARRSPSDVMRARVLGASAYVAKPCDLALLQRRIRAILDQSSSAQKREAEPALVFGDAATSAFWLE